MSTSGSTSYSLNTQQLVNFACHLINAIPLNQSAPYYIYDAVLTALNLMCKTWMAEKRYLWAWTEKSGITIVADQQSYTIGPSGADITMEKPMEIMSLRIRNTADETDVPIELVNRKEYQQGFTAKTSVNNTGFPTAAYYDPQRDTGVLYLNGVPNTEVATDYTMRFDYPRRIEDFVSTADAPDFTQEYLETVVYNLAVRIRPLFPAVLIQEIQDVIARAQQLYNDMPVYTGELEENLVFEPDRVDEF